MYLKDKNRRLDIRVDNDTYDFLMQVTIAHETTYSEYIRKLIFTDMVKKGYYENKEADFNNFV